MHFDVESLKKFPSSPGVYIMKNSKNVVLYVGKAKNLKQRVRQYFLSAGDGREMIPFLIAHVAEIDTIVVSSEKEALLLENTLIKRHQPKYNVLLKDDKSYIALRIDHKSDWPMVHLVRYRGQPKPGFLYFGPYTSAMAARKTLDLLNRLFPLRQCSDKEFSRRTRPCILYGMKRCVAPCVGFCSKEEYAGHVARTIQFLKGQDKEVLKGLYAEIERYSSGLEFEKAQELLQTVRQIERTMEQQNVDKPLGLDSDALGIYREGDRVTLCQMIFRGGKLVGSCEFHFQEILQDDAELLISFVLQNYEKQAEVPHEILLPVVCEDLGEVEEILSAERSRKVYLLCPQRGEKVAMLSMARENAKASFTKEHDAKAVLENTLTLMQEKLHLMNFPEVIECFDNSNISGDEPVATMVVFKEGEKDAGRYRKYKIKTAKASDDYGAMYEVLSRRYLKAKQDQELPSLIIVDGGKGQLNIALKVLSELDIINVDVIGLAKEQGRHDKGTSEEQIFLPNIKDPILLKRNSPVLFLLQKIRDEAHRTAIAFQRKRRGKKMMKSCLDDIQRIGPAKRKLLLKRFGSVKAIKEASLEELQGVKGISLANARAIREGMTQR